MRNGKIRTDFGKGVRANLRNQLSFIIGADPDFIDKRKFGYNFKWYLSDLVVNNCGLFSIDDYNNIMELGLKKDEISKIERTIISNLNENFVSIKVKLYLHSGSYGNCGSFRVYVRLI